MTDMKIFIPTRRREEQRTWKYLYEAGLNDMVRIVCDEDDRKRLEKQHPEMIFCVTPESVSGIGHTRQWICEQGPVLTGARYVLMMDDDQQFYARKTEEDWHLRNATTTDIISMVTLMNELARDTDSPMIGLSARQGNQNYTEQIVYNKRIHNTYVIDTVAFAKNGVRFDRMPLMEDFDTALQFLRLGLKTTMVAKYAWGQRASNAAGGCSLYRTNDLQSQAAERLAALHPDFVKVVIKKPKTGWKNLEVRKDVRVQWKKAYESGLENA